MHDEQIKIIAIERYQTKAKLTLSNAQVYFLPIEVLITHQLVEAIVLTESQVEIIEFEATLYETFAKAKQYLAMRDHSTGELKIKLKKKKFPDETISQTLSKCQKLGYIDDEKYAYKLAEKLVIKKPFFNFRFCTVFKDSSSEYLSAGITFRPLTLRSLNTTKELKMGT